MELLQCSLSPFWRPSHFPAGGRSACDCQGSAAGPQSPTAKVAWCGVILAALRRGSRPRHAASFRARSFQDVLSPLLPESVGVFNKEVPVLPKKKLKKRLYDLRDQLEPLDGKSVSRVCDLLREAALKGLPWQQLEPWLQQLLYRITTKDSTEFQKILLLCRDLLDIAGETYPGEALSSILIAALVQRGKLEVAEQMLNNAAGDLNLWHLWLSRDKSACVTCCVISKCHVFSFFHNFGSKVAHDRVKMRSFQPILGAFTDIGDTTRLRGLFNHVLHPLVLQDAVRLNGSAIQTLLLGFCGRPDWQEEVLVLLSKAELELKIDVLRLPYEWLQRIQESIEDSPKDYGLRAEFTLAPELSIDGWHCRPTLRHLIAARQRAGNVLERLDEAMYDGGVTCLIDGPNIGYRGAVQRRSVFEGRRDGGKNFSMEEDEIVENLHAPYFRHDQIDVTLRQLQEQGEVPLVVMPARYTFAHLGDVRDKDQIGPFVPLNQWVEKWLSKQQIFVTSDDEPDDAVWLYATLDTAIESDGRVFVVTRDKAQNHRSQVWGIRFNEGDRAIELERSWRRWSALYLRWFAISWADCDHFSEDSFRPKNFTAQNKHI
eukprot:s1355_g1.t10